MGLFDFVIADVPSNTRVPELGNTNAKRTLYDNREQTGQDVSAGTGVTEATVRLYLAYLVAIGFLLAPLSNGKGTKALTTVELSDEQKQVLARVGGRGGVSRLEKSSKKWK